MLRFIISILLCGLLAGCRQMAPVSNSSTSTDTKIIRNYSDTLYRDRWHTLLVKGDTVFIHDSIAYTTIRNHTDTLYRDSISYIERTITVPAELNGWQRFLQDLGYVAFGLLLGGAFLLVMKLFIKFK